MIKYKKNKLNAMNSYKKALVAIHVAVWLVILISPLTFFDRGDRFEADKLIPMFSTPIAMMLVFYTTYLYLTPKLLLKGQKRKFWTYTIALVILMGLGLHIWFQVSHRVFFHPEHHLHPMKKMREPNALMDLIFILRNVFNMTVTAAIAAMSILSIKWQSSETARREAEMAKQDAELKNLRNQVNPHFLLNTLNNIYALTAFNQQKAQEAILELSGMLRHILYDNQQDFVRLDDEIKFIHSYINLMKIRIPKTTKIQIDVNVPKDTELKIAPLIFISLIENAFKHGIGTAENSFIHINIYADRNHIACEIENSNFPKNDTDRSGHGIGLEQVGKRLELAYHKKYTWEKGTKDNNKIYYSNIYIYDTKLRNNGRRAAGSRTAGKLCSEGAIPQSGRSVQQCHTSNKDHTRKKDRPDIPRHPDAGTQRTGICKDNQQGNENHVHYNMRLTATMLMPSTIF